MRKDLLKESRIYAFVSVIMFVVAMICYASEHSLVRMITWLSIRISFVFLFIAILIFILGLLKKRPAKYRALKGRRKPLRIFLR